LLQPICRAAAGGQSVRHQHRHWAFPQHGRGDATEKVLAELAVLIGAPGCSAVAMPMPLDAPVTMNPYRYGLNSRITPSRSSMGSVRFLS